MKTYEPSSVHCDAKSLRSIIWAMWLNTQDRWLFSQRGLAGKLQFEPAAQKVLEGQDLNILLTHNAKYRALWTHFRYEDWAHERARQVASEMVRFVNEKLPSDVDLEAAMKKCDVRAAYDGARRVLVKIETALIQGNTERAHEILSGALKNLDELLKEAK